MTWELINADVIEGLRQLPDASVHCVVTSPPYWGLRDYGTPAQVWGGDPECDHEWGETMRTPWANNLPGPNGRKLNSDAARQRPKETGPFCQKCDAWRGSLGLEPTPELFVRNLVLVFREVWRVLRPDGVAFVNLGDSYAGSWGAMSYAKGDIASRRFGGDGEKIARPVTSRLTGNLKAKDLVGIPWRVAFALQSDGWYLRSDIIWSKPNPMPESVTDRPTKTHEYIFMLSKNKRYFYDSEAVKERSKSGPSDVRKMVERQDRIGGKYKDLEDPLSAASASSNVGRKKAVGSPDGRNRRSVWTVATTPNPEAHFATFPEELAEICIKAGSSERGCCAKCGAPWVRMVEKQGGSWKKRKSNGAPMRYGLEPPETPVGAIATKTAGWRSSCKCADDGLPVDCVVLDPFAGTSTTGVVAARLGRRFIGIELSNEYCRIGERLLREAERQAYGDLFLPLVKEAEQGSLFQKVEEE